VVSEPLRHQVLAFGVAPAKILVNPNGVDVSQFRPRAAGAVVRQRLGLESAVVIGFSGTFGVWHGIPTLVQSMRQVLAARPDVRFLLVGDGPLRELIDRTAVDARVCLTGMLPHAQMPEHLAACDILVSPHGRQADGGEFFGSPTKLFEYMAAGRPIVASSVGQIAQVLEHEVSALLVPAEDPDALAAAILRLVADASLRARLGQVARLHAETKHTWRQNAERLLASLAPV
jgi:glycosyltransferase involved in cell wall biosynthesis